MRFFYAKKEQTCRHCKGSIYYGDEAVVIRWKPSGGVFVIPLVFHVTCYLEWITNNFNTRWNDWKMGSSPRPVRRIRGRKFLYANREQAKEANRLKSLMSYHKKAGNEVRVVEVEQELSRLILDK